MSAPTLPREVFCFVEEVGDEQFPDTLVTTLTSERDLAAWREGVLRLKEAELSPIGRYVLADEERERMRDACVEFVAKHVSAPFGADWACVRCRPESDCIVDGFACLHHQAIDAVSEHRRDGR